MTDLATRIADARKKAKAWITQKAITRNKSTIAHNRAEREFTEAASPDLFIEMEAEIAALKADRDTWRTNYFKDIEALQKEIAALTAKLEKAREALEDAAECIESWGGYASAYFQDKHDLAGDIERIRTAARVHAETKPQSQS